MWIDQNSVMQSFQELFKKITLAHFFLRHGVDQCKQLLWLRIRHSDIVLLRTMSVLNRTEFVAVCTKYSHDVDLMALGRIVNVMLDNFARL